MRIDILTVLPEMFESPLGCSILKRARDKGLSAEIVVHNLRDYTTDRHRKVDDYPFGGRGGDGDESPAGGGLHQCPEVPKGI